MRETQWVDELADRANEGRLSEKERAEYRTATRMVHMIETILQARLSASPANSGSVVRWMRPCVNLSCTAPVIAAEQTVGPRMRPGVDLPRRTHPARQHRGGDANVAFGFGVSGLQSSQGTESHAIDPNAARSQSPLRSTPGTSTSPWKVHASKVSVQRGGDRVTADMNNDERKRMRGGTAGCLGECEEN